MTDEVVEQTQEFDIEQQDADFDAGFYGKETEPVVEEKEEVEGEQQTEEAAPSQDAAPILIAGLTEDQLKSSLAKIGELEKYKEEIQKVYGKFGEVNRTIQAIQATQQSRGGIKLSPDALKRFSSQYPEMAADLAEDLNEALSSGIPAAISQEEIDRRVAEAKKQMADEAFKQSVELLDDLHPDWREIKDSDEFGFWKSNVLSDAQRQKISTNNAFLAARFIDQFKDWKAKAAQEKQEAEAASAQSRQEKQKRLSAAIPPTRGAVTVPTSPSEDDDFNEGFYGPNWKSRRA